MQKFTIVVLLLLYSFCISSCDSTYFTSSGDTKSYLYDMEGANEIRISMTQNQANSNVTFNFSIALERVYDIKLLDMYGRIIKSEADKAIPGENTHVMNLDAIEKGRYIISFTIGETYRGKLEIQ